MLPFITRLIAPSFCAYCRIFLDRSAVLCDHCSRRIRPIVAHMLEVTSTKIMMVHAIGMYDQPLVSLILAKSSGNRTTAYQLGELMWQRSIIAHLSFDYIVPIPLHWTRYAWRGYNQAEEIANVIAKKSEKPIAHLLKRVRRTPYQSYFKGDDRMKNVQGVFRLSGSPTPYTNKHVLLVDDVMTSGATLKEAAEVLWSLQPASITAIVVARTK